MMFSIVIPTFDRDAELRAALASCLAQTDPDFEVVVVDDASAVAAAPICAAFADARIACHRNARNLGASAARNAGLRQARGDYVVFLDSDDLMLPEKLAVLRRTIANGRPDTVLHRQYRVFDRSREGFRYEILPARTIREGDRLEEFTFRDGQYYNMNSICVRREIALAVGFRDGMRMLEDQAFVFDCVARSRSWRAIDDPLAVYLDDARGARASHRFRREADFRAFLDYAEAALSARSRRMIAAMVHAETGFWRAPLATTAAIVSGFHAGVPLDRSILYAIRAVFGTRVAAALVDLRRRRSAHGKVATPDWARPLSP